MKMLALAAIAAVALTGCSGGSHDYAMSVDEAQSKLLGATFERGILPGSSGLKPRVLVSSEGDGSLEWHVQNESERSGWWCPMVFEKTSDEPNDADEPQSMSAGDERQQQVQRGPFDPLSDRLARLSGHPHAVNYSAQAAALKRSRRKRASTRPG